MKTAMKLRRSPTLEIGEKIKAAKSENKKLLSLSTPSLPNYIGELKTDKSWGKLTPAAGLPELIERTETEIFANWNCSNHKVVISAGAKSSLFTICSGRWGTAPWGLWWGPWCSNYPPSY